MADQIFLFVLITLVFVFLIWGRIRYDIIAFSALIIAGVVGVIPKEQVFSGFGHPAVLIVALVLVVSKGLSRSGAIELIAKQVLSAKRTLQTHIGIMATISALLSSVMNNVAALALLMPVDMQAAQKAKRSPASTLMPLSFASILGGMVTLIGTPPNIVIATYREDALGEPFRMFDFAPVGAAVAVVGVLFVVYLGWRMIPAERTKHNSAKELEDLKGFVAEVRVPETSKIIEQRVRDLDKMADENDILILGVVRRGKRLPGAARREQLRKNDLLVVQGSHNAIDQFVGAAGLTFGSSEKQQSVVSETSSLVEVVVPVGATIEGRSALDVRLLYRQGVMLLGISRKGKPIRERVRREPMQAGDILLLLGPEGQINDVVDWLGCLPLAQRGLEVTLRSKASLAVAIFAGAILAASIGLVYLPMALAAVVVLYVLTGIVPLSGLYESIEWPVIVLLGSMIPIGAALEASGGTAQVANLIVSVTEGLPTVAVLAILMIVTMTLSDMLNNVATALIAAPIGIDIANRLDANPDAFLMAVAVSASCAFLTPIGHKNNTIIMGPGGYQFGDYWRMGLPLELLVLVVGIPMILLVWPL